MISLTWVNYLSTSSNYLSTILLCYVTWVHVCKINHPTFYIWEIRFMKQITRIPIKDSYRWWFTPVPVCTHGRLRGFQNTLTNICPIQELTPLNEDCQILPLKQVFIKSYHKAWSKKWNGIKQPFSWKHTLLNPSLWFLQFMFILQEQHFFHIFRGEGT